MKTTDSKRAAAHLDEAWHAVTDIVIDSIDRTVALTMGMNDQYDKPLYLALADLRKSATWVSADLARAIDVLMDTPEHSVRVEL